MITLRMAVLVAATICLLAALPAQASSTGATGNGPNLEEGWTVMPKQTVDGQNNLPPALPWYRRAYNYWTKPKVNAPASGTATETTALGPSTAGTISPQRSTLGRASALTTETISLHLFDSPRAGSVGSTRSGSKKRPNSSSNRLRMSQRGDSAFSSSVEVSHDSPPGSLGHQPDNVQPTPGSLFGSWVEVSRDSPPSSPLGHQPDSMQPTPPSTLKRSRTSQRGDSLSGSWVEVSRDSPPASPLGHQPGSMQPTPPLIGTVQQPSAQKPKKSESWWSYIFGNKAQQPVEETTATQTWGEMWSNRAWWLGGNGDTTDPQTHSEPNSAHQPGAAVPSDDEIECGTVKDAVNEFQTNAIAAFRQAVGTVHRVAISPKGACQLAKDSLATASDLFKKALHESKKLDSASEQNRVIVRVKGYLILIGLLRHVSLRFTCMAGRVFRGVTGGKRRSQDVERDALRRSSSDLNTIQGENAACSETSTYTNSKGKGRARRSVSLFSSE